MNIEKMTEKLVRHIENDRNLQRVLPGAEGPTVYHDGHMGAILADTALQRQVDYAKVVLPQVDRIAKYPDCQTMTGLRDMLASSRNEEFLDFYGRFHREKRVVFCNLVLQVPADVETAADVKGWLSSEDERHALQAIDNVGPKTADYLFQRCGGDIVVPDVHIFKYVSRAVGEEIPPTKYYSCQQIVTDAAEKLGISPRKLDAAIWHLGAECE